MRFACVAAALLSQLRAELSTGAAVVEAAVAQLAAASSESAWAEAAGHLAVQAGASAEAAPATVEARPVVAHVPESPDEAAPSFPRYMHQVAALDGEWEYAFGAAEVPTRPTTTAPVPGPLPASGDLGVARGLALYRRKVDIPGGQYARLQFFGCGFICEVFVDGQKAAAHEGAYTMFWVDIPMTAADRTVELRVHVDSRFHDDVLLVQGAGALDGEYRPAAKHLHEAATAYEGPAGARLARDGDGWTLGSGAARYTTAGADPAGAWVSEGGGDAPTVTDASVPGALHKAGFDFMQYGGLHRPVRLHLLPPGVSSMVEDVDVKQDPAPAVASAHGTALRFRVHHMAEPQALHVTATSTYLAKPLQLTLPKAALSKLEVKLAGPRWSPAAPNLATLTVTGPSGGLTVRFGLRRVTTCEDGRVCVDDTPTKLVGFCMHNLHPDFRSTVPRVALQAQVQQARASGANFLRLVHYPHDPRVLEIADEAGMLVWVETLGWGNSKEDLTNPTFIDAQVAMLDESVHVTFNHPSVILFGFLNEGANDAVATCGAYKQLAERYRAWQVNGLVSWASNRYENDKCLEHSDVITYNTYPGWYGGGPETVADSLSTMAAQARAANPGKPFLIGEIGAAAIPDSVKWSMPAFLTDHQPDGGKRGHWSESYQAAVDAAAAAAVVGNPDIGGAALWQLFDVVTGEALFYLRPRGFNNKGVLTERLAPKQAYRAVAAEFRKSEVLAPPARCRDHDCGRGKCVVNTAGLGACSCYEGFSGERCDVSGAVVVPSRRPAEGFAKAHVPQLAAAPASAKGAPLPLKLRLALPSYWAMLVGLAVVAVLLGFAGRAYGTKGR